MELGYTATQDVLHIIEYGVVSGTCFFLKLRFTNGVKFKSNDYNLGRFEYFAHHVL